MNAIDFMTRIEEDGLRLYEMLSQEATNSERKEIFTLLADSQKRHLNAIIALKKTMSSTVADEIEVPETEYLHNGFRRLMKSPDIMGTLKNDPDGFGHVVTTEEEIIRVLEGLASCEPQKDVCRVMQRIVNDEREHLSKIENIYDFIETPHTYLEWGEFSNLHPL
jgi:rubrerythrin